MVNYARQLNLSCLPLGKKYDLRCLPLRKKYRSRFEIMALILEAVKNNGAARFSIMKQASINCTQLNKHLECLTEMGFIEMNIKDGRVLYKASEKGLDFLKQYYVLLGIMLSTHV